MSTIDFNNHYLRVQVRLPGNKLRTFWGFKLRQRRKTIIFRVVNSEGDEQNEIVLAQPTDILSEKAAVLSKKYGVLEIAVEEEEKERAAERAAHADFEKFAALLKERYGITPADAGIDGPGDMPSGKTHEELASDIAERYDLHPLRAQW